MLVLSICQPYSELILRGIKTAELRSRPTTIIGPRFYLYARPRPKRNSRWSEDLQVGTPPAWMIKLATQVGMTEPDALLRTDLPAKGNTHQHQIAGDKANLALD